MADHTSKAVVTSIGGLAVKAKARGFEIAIDEPKSIGGSDTGMTPSELILSALGACQTILAMAFARRWGLELREYRVELEGDIDPDGYQGLAEVRPGYSHIRYRVYIQSDAPMERLQEYVRFIERICPVGDTIVNTVPVSLEDVVIET